MHIVVGCDVFLLGATDRVILNLAVLVQFLYTRLVSIFQKLAPMDFLPVLIWDSIMYLFLWSLLFSLIGFQGMAEGLLITHNTRLDQTFLTSVAHNVRI
jgi:hypothetical protein